VKIETLTVGPFETNCYIVIFEKKAVIIDPGFEADRITEILRKKNVKAKYIFYTHAHYDHIGSSAEVKKETNASVIMGEKEKSFFDDPSSVTCSMLQMSSKPAAPDILCREGEEFHIEGCSMKIIETPGHTPGGISIFSENALFTGDCIFMGSIGRTDLPGGDSEELKKTIKKKILSLSDNVKIYPGHGPATSVKREKKDNLYAR